MPHPLPWYIAGALIGLMVPALLLVGNKAFGSALFGTWTYGYFRPRLLH